MAEMTINGKDIRTFNARLMNFSVSGTSITTNVSQATDHPVIPLIYGVTYSPRTLTITLSFHPKQHGSDSRNTRISERLFRGAENVTSFETEIIGKLAEIHLPDGYFYTAIYTGSNPSEVDATGIYDVSYIFSAIRHLNKQIVKGFGTLSVFSPANVDTRVKITLLCQVPRNSIQINISGQSSLTINSVSAPSIIIIDSINGIITENGVNKFGDTDFIEFFKLIPGLNRVTCSDSSAEMTIEFIPILM